MKNNKEFRVGKIEWDSSKIIFHQFNTDGLPDISDYMRVKIAKAMMIKADELIINGAGERKYFYDTSTLSTATVCNVTTQLTKEALDNALALMYRDTPQKRMSKAVIDTLREHGLHPDMLHKVSYAVYSAQGQTLVEHLTLADIRDIEALAQKFIALYSELTK